MCKFRDFDKYEIYEDGRIWSYKTNRFLKPGTDKNGYQQVLLSDNEGKSKMYLLHRVVYEAVTGSPIPYGYEINHIDERKYNNARNNLELISHKQNINYGTRNSRAGKSISKAMTNNPKISKAVGAFKNGELVMTFKSAREAGRQGYNQGNVAACCRGERKTNKGYTWRYL